MKGRIALTREALRLALNIRRKVGFAWEEPICIFECAQRLGVEVRFLGAPSLEGMYASSGSGVIIVSSLRPLGRQTFTCAHELGHHILGHGSRWDEYVGDSDKDQTKGPEEWLADRFASYILMPKQAVLRSFSARGWTPATCSADQVFIIAGELGVGYGTLISQMQLSLNLIGDDAAESLRRISLTNLRQSISGHNCKQNLVVVDDCWYCRPIDIQTGDWILLPHGITLKGQAVRNEGESSKGILVQGLKPGISQAVHANKNWARFIRVRREGYIGRASFRHLEDPDD